LHLITELSSAHRSRDCRKDRGPAVSWSTRDCCSCRRMRKLPRRVRARSRLRARRVPAIFTAECRAGSNAGLARRRLAPCHRHHRRRSSSRRAAREMTRDDAQVLTRGRIRVGSPGSCDRPRHETVTRVRSAGLGGKWSGWRGEGTPVCPRSRTDRPSSRSQPSRGSATTSCFSIPRESTIPRPALNATMSSMAPGAAKVGQAGGGTSARRVGETVDAAEIVNEVVARLEAEPIQGRHIALDPLHLNAVLGCPPPRAGERLVDGVDPGHAPPALCQIAGVASRAAAHVERATGHPGRPCLRAAAPTTRQRPFAPRERTPADTSTLRGAPVTS
jgi:hypothetical protein